MFALKEKGYSLRAIARTLGRSVSTISDELKRNSYGSDDRTPASKQLSYDPTTAQQKAYVRRREAKFQGMTIAKAQDLQAFIAGALLKRQSPQAIAGRLATGLDGLPYVSRDTIERFIRSVHGRKLEYELSQLKRTNERRTKKRFTVETLPDRTFIDDRPRVIANRERIGDLEVDFIVSGKNGTGYLLTAADRKSRYGFIRKVLPVSVAGAEAALLDIKHMFPELLSVTTDNDILFRYHQHIEEILGVSVYFCHPYHSWEKGTIENFNKQVRKYIPKGADISASQYTAEYLAFIESRLNSRFMGVLGVQDTERMFRGVPENKEKG